MIVLLLQLYMTREQNDIHIPLVNYWAAFMGKEKADDIDGHALVQTAILGGTRKRRE